MKRRSFVGSLARIFGALLAFWLVLYLWASLLSASHFHELSRLSVARGNPDFYDSDVVNLYDFADGLQTIDASLLDDGKTADQTQVELVFRKLTAIYVSRVRHLTYQLLSTNSDDKREAMRQVRLVQFSCETSGKCDAIGHRFQGMVSAFYLAVFADAIFECKWENSDVLDNYFATNRHFYDLTQGDITGLDAFIKQPSSSLIEFNFIGNVEQAAHNSWQGDSFALINHHTITRVHANSILPLEKIRSHETFKKKIREYNLTDASNAILMSAGLRFILGRPRSRLRYLVERLVGDKMGDRSQLKIGVHIRLVDNGDQDSDGEPPIRLDNVGCFAAQVGRLIAAHSPRRNASVFISTDTDGAFAEFESKLTRLEPNTPVVKLDGNVTMKTVDRAIFAKNQPTNIELWQPNTGLFGDWLALTQMDFLVIGRSSFSETAAIFSMKPTLRFLRPKSSRKNDCHFERFRLSR